MAKNGNGSLATPNGFPWYAIHDEASLLDFESSSARVGLCNYLSKKLLQQDFGTWRDPNTSVLFVI